MIVWLLFIEFMQLKRASYIKIYSVKLLVKLLPNIMSLYNIVFRYNFHPLHAKTMHCTCHQLQTMCTFLEECLTVLANLV